MQSIGNASRRLPRESRPKTKETPMASHDLEFIVPNRPVGDATFSGFMALIDWGGVQALLQPRAAAGEAEHVQAEHAGVMMASVSLLLCAAACGVWFAGRS